MCSFDHEVTLSTVKETAAYIINLIETNPSVTHPHPEPTEASIPLLHSTLHFPLSSSSSVSLASISPHPLDPPELIREIDLLTEVVRQSLYLFQQITADTVKSILIVSRCQLDVNTKSFQSLLLLLIQRDICLWCLPLLNTSSRSCLHTDDCTEMQVLCRITGGECVYETVCIHEGYHSVDIVISYLPSFG